MKKLIGIGLFLSLQFFCCAKSLDLIVTTDGDSVACKILEVNDSEIVFMMKALGHKNVKTVLSREKIAEYKYDVIKEDLYYFKPGTSYIIGKAYPITSKTYSLEYLQSAPGEESGYYLYKAEKLQETGKILNIVGASALGASILSIIAFGDQMELGVVLLFFPAAAGIGTMAVGIPMNLTGKNRVKRINSIRNTAFNDIKINLQPCAQYNLMTQNYQPGVTLKINF